MNAECGGRAAYAVRQAGEVSRQKRALSASKEMAVS